MQVGEPEPESEETSDPVPLRVSPVTVFRHRSYRNLCLRTGVDPFPQFRLRKGHSQTLMICQGLWVARESTPRLQFSGRKAELEHRGGEE